MSLISFEIKFNHIFLLLVFITYFFREWFLYILDLPKTKILNKFFLLYVKPISYLFSILLVCISYINNRRKKEKIKKSKKNIELIHYNPIKNLFISGIFFVSLFFFLSKYLIFIFHVFTETKTYNVESFLIFYLIFIYSLSKIIQKIQYYRHHFLSFIICIILMIILGIFDYQTIHDNWKKN